MGKIVIENKTQYFSLDNCRWQILLLKKNIMKAKLKKIKVYLLQWQEKYKKFCDMVMQGNKDTDIAKVCKIK